jgi:hypothetical protein
MSFTKLRQERNMIDRTTEQQAALDYIKDTLRPHVGGVLDEFSALLFSAPAEDIDRKTDNLGHCLKLAFDQVAAPDISEACDGRSHLDLRFCCASASNNKKRPHTEPLKTSTTAYQGANAIGGKTFRHRVGFIGGTVVPAAIRFCRTADARLADRRINLKLSRT